MVLIRMTRMMLIIILDVTELMLIIILDVTEFHYIRAIMLLLQRRLTKTCWAKNQILNISGVELSGDLF